MTDSQRALLDKALRALEAVEASVSRDDGETVINRAYYAAFHAALAALEDTGEHSKTHHGTLRRFQYHFVLTGRIPAAIGEILSQALDFRQQVDYDAFCDIDLRAATALQADVQRFVSAVEMLISK